MSKQVIYTSEGPQPIGPYSQAILKNDTLYMSGQIAIDPTTGGLINDDISKETHQVMKNIGEILHAADMDYSNIVKCSIFISDMNDFSVINKAYGTYFKENPPARETVEVSNLPMFVNVEISCIAIK
ncbi:MAG: Rid family detoxifying hydrolase [Cyclobacteriaceae bacterium]|nr:Rid family detoxifying hydrolase [Cyclobacteriaceae bacterium]